ncbi:MAG TPA: TonB family protein, partial [Bacteroidia bacterium]|nr:TonB family protein [Bacteroidia bacterium]
VVEDDVETDDEPLPETDQNKDYKPTENRKPVEEPQPEQTNEPEIFDIVENPPTFSGGDAAMQKFIRDNLVYPPLAVENGLQGRVIVQFVVEPDGRVTDVKALKFFDEDCAKEAIRVVKLMRWNPGKQRNKAVKTRMVIPITFKLS